MSEMNLPANQKRDELLVLEYKELSDYAKALITVVMRWWAFFILANLLVVGWIWTYRSKGAQGLLDFNTDEPQVLFALVIVFFLVIVLSILGLRHLELTLKNIDDRVSSIIGELIKDEVANKSILSAPRSPIPIRLIETAVRFMRIALYFIAGFWVYNGHELMLASLYSSL